MFHIYTPWKHQKTTGFLAFSGGSEIEQQDGFVNTKLNITCISNVFVPPLKQYLKKSRSKNFPQQFLIQPKKPGGNAGS